MGLPDDFLRHVASNGYVVPPAKTFHIGDAAFSNTFDRWALRRMPPPTLRAGTLSLQEAQARAAELSTERTPFHIEPFEGRWHIVGGYYDGWIVPLTPGELDDLLGKARVGGAPISPEEATQIARRYAGPDVEISYAAAGLDTWRVREKTPSGPTLLEEPRRDALGVELFVSHARRACERALARPVTLEDVARRLGSRFTITESTSAKGLV